MIVGGGEAQTAIKHEGLLGHVDDEFTACAVIDFPTGMVALEREIGELLKSLSEGLGTAIIAIIRLGGSGGFDGSFRARNCPARSVEADAFLDGAAVTATVEADLNAGNSCHFAGAESRPP